MVLPLVLAIIVLLLTWVIKRLTKKTTAVGVSPFYLISNNAHTKLHDYIVKHRNVHAVEVRGGNFVILTHPDSVKDLMKNDKTTTLPPNSSVSQLILNSVFSVNGDIWKHQRGIVNPAFTSESLPKIVPIFVELSRQFLSLIEEIDDIDIKPVIQNFTLDALGAGSFGHSLGMMKGETNLYKKAFVELLKSPFHPVEFIFPYYENLFSHRKALIKAVVEMSHETMEKRRKERKKGEESKFLLDLLLDSDLSPTEIRNNIWIFYLAGHETTATSLSWCFNYLAKHPELQQTMYEEIIDKIGKDGQPTYENLKELTFMDMFIKEVLRIVPPFPLFSTRKSAITTEIDGLIVPPQTKVTTNIYVIHHHPDFWPDPERFDPYRFTTEKSKDRHPFSYLPFSLGRRHCVGMNFSLLEQKILLAQVVRKFAIIYKQDAVMVETRFLPPQSVHIGLKQRI